jgi:dienelactone hydrolase
MLAIFGRFYAGGSVWNDVQDMVAGLKFPGTQSSVDATRIGMIGMSWGDFETVYGSAYADANVRPMAGEAIAPVIEFQALKTFLGTPLQGLTNVTTYPHTPHSSIPICAGCSQRQVEAIIPA